MAEGMAFKVSATPAARRSAVASRNIRRLTLLVLGPILVSALALLANSVAYAAGGTATPPLPGFGTPPPQATPAPEVPAPIFSAPPETIIGFTAIGFIKKATVTDANCTGLPRRQWGGTAVINEIEIVIPCNSIVQMPAATFTWAELFSTSSGPGSQGFKSTQSPPAQLPLAASPTTFGNGVFAYPSVEMRIEGNVVGNRHIAGLIYISQQSLNTTTGYISGFDYDKGVIFVSGSALGAPQVRLELNDPEGRFSKGQSPDTRFSVDDRNPTVRSATGYPMCVPRKDPASGDDPRCPQRNRPLVAQGCRNFAAAGVFLPAGRELTPPAAGQTYCSSFVMGDPATAGPTEPAATEQAPFEIGDLITFSATLLAGDTKGPGGSETLSAHTVIGNVGIYTQPGTLPVYLVLDEFGVGTEAPILFNGLVPQEAADKLVVNAFVTDVTSVVDVYFVDIDATTGQETQRWISPQSMTGGLGTIDGNGFVLDGGITTQFTGPVPGRVRLQATKTGPGMLASPTRMLRIATRSLCDPSEINTMKPVLGKPNAGPVRCLDRAPAANGLSSGQYAAPVFDYLFPETVVAGDRRVPNDLWALGFLSLGEGPGTGPLLPPPW